jgi:arabinosyltransferase C
LFERTFLRATAVAAIVILSLTFLYGVALAPAGSQYLGFPFATDDHMVYAAWMHQAMNGHFLFDNRFTTDPQSGLTIHLYFWVIGLIARVTGIVWASNIARVVCAVIFIGLLWRLLKCAGRELYANKFALVMTLVGGGVGFLVWHDFGVDLVRPSSLWLAPVTGGKLPTDVWQPEAFVFSSLLSNGLFAASLCLIALIFRCVLDAREGGWKPVAIGAVAMAVLMNIHSYDVLLIVFVLVGLLVAQFNGHNLCRDWVMKAFVIGCGAILPAVWFVHVLSVDPVFQARAATPTYSPNFRAVLVGYLPLVVLALVSLARRVSPSAAITKRRIIGLVLVGVLLLGLAGYAFVPYDGFFLSLPIWAVVFAVALGAIYLLADENPAINLLISWAIIGMVAIYFPGLFQRKLAMGLSIPWAALSGFGLADLLMPAPRSTRNFVTALALLGFGGTSIQWLLRESRLIKGNVSVTTMQALYLPSGVVRALDYIERAASSRRVVVQAMPGIPVPEADSDGARIEDSYDSPLVPDLNPVVSGLTGAYTFAGHWSETPNYDQRRTELSQSLFSNRVSDEQRRAFLQTTETTFILTPKPGAVSGITVPDLSTLGSVVVDSPTFVLIEVK